MFDIKDAKNLSQAGLLKSGDMPEAVTLYVMQPDGINDTEGWNALAKRLNAKMEVTPCSK